MKDIIIFGSSGSIGKNALEVISQEPKKYKIKGLAVLKDTTTLYQQIKKFNPEYVAVYDDKAGQELKKNLPKNIRLFIGNKGLEEFSQLNSDISIMAIAGISCLKPLFLNIKNAKRIALANKESIVVGGDFIFNQAKKYNVEIIPVDSEISSLFQLLNHENKYLDKVYITASGGSLYDYNKRDLAKVTVKEAVNHPTWDMGPRITIDSATLVNKGFEVIETHRFFNIDYEKIKVLIHKQSMVHALVEYKDKTFFSCIYNPDMKLPIAYALSYPQRNIFGRNKADIGLKDICLTFEPLKTGKFPLFDLIVAAAKREDNSLAILNAIDEIAIEYFLSGKIKFTGIHKTMEYFFSHYTKNKINKLEDVFFWDDWARKKAVEYLGSDLHFRN